MNQDVFWALPAAVVILSAGASLYGWRLKVRFERDHPRLTRAALKAESDLTATSVLKADVISIRTGQKISGPERASGSHK